MSKKRPYSIDFSKTTSKTQQSFKESCDVNNILARYQKTGIIDHVRKNQEEYGIATGQSFSEAMQLIASATNLFNELPSAARKHFNHDPAAFFDYMNDQDTPPDVALLHELGLTGKPMPMPGVEETPLRNDSAASDAASGKEQAE